MSYKFSRCNKFFNFAVVAIYVAQIFLPLTLVSAEVKFKISPKEERTLAKPIFTSTTSKTNSNLAVVKRNGKGTTVVLPLTTESYKSILLSAKTPLPKGYYIAAVPNQKKKGVFLRSAKYKKLSNSLSKVLSFATADGVVALNLTKSALLSQNFIAKNGTTGVTSTTTANSITQLLQNSGINLDPGILTLISWIVGLFTNVTAGTTTNNSNGNTNTNNNTTNNNGGNINNNSTTNNNNSTTNQTTSNNVPAICSATHYWYLDQAGNSSCCYGTCQYNGCKRGPTPDAACMFPNGTSYQSCGTGDPTINCGPRPKDPTCPTARPYKYTNAEANYAGLNYPPRVHACCASSEGPASNCEQTGQTGPGSNGQGGGAEFYEPPYGIVPGPGGANDVPPGANPTCYGGALVACIGPNGLPNGTCGYPSGFEFALWGRACGNNTLECCSTDAKRGDPIVPSCKNSFNCISECTCL